MEGVEIPTHREDWCITMAGSGRMRLLLQVQLERRPGSLGQLSTDLHERCGDYESMLMHQGRMWYCQVCLLLKKGDCVGVGRSFFMVDSLIHGLPMCILAS